MLVLLNPNAGGGTAAERWTVVEPEVRRATGGDGVGSVETVSVGSFDQLRHLVADRLGRGERTFVAAGGDGTVHELVNALMPALDSGHLEDVRLGAVGLGSSNDFHKPLSDRRLVDGVSLRLDVTRARVHDVGELRYRDPSGREGRRWWLVNGSVGLTAEANAYFNGPDPIVRRLKRGATGLAIGWAALRTLWRVRPRRFHVTIDDERGEWRTLSNLGVVKNPHFAGDFRYDSPLEPDSGRFHVHELGDLSRPGLLRALARLARGRFAGTPAARTVVARRLLLRAPEPFAVEVDGEVLVVREAEFTLYPRRLALCA